MAPTNNGSDNEVDAILNPPPEKKLKTHAVPLSVSSMTRLEDVSENQGSLLGLETMVHHTLLACFKKTPHLVASGDWKAVKISKTDIAPALSRALLGFDYAYARYCLLKDGSATNASVPAAVQPPSSDTEKKPAWQEDASILGCISLYYASQDEMEEDELLLPMDDVDEEENSQDLPATILYKAVVEYKTRRPSSGHMAARQAEELSMLTFGASIDDDVKFGALASVYDQVGKYVLEINSVRQKTYAFDVADAVLSDGSVPSWSNKKISGPKEDEENGVMVKKDENEGDPFGKSLWLTVTDNSPDDIEVAKRASDASINTERRGSLAGGSNMTRLILTLQGTLRPDALENLPSFHSIPRKLKRTFPLLGNPKAILASRCGQALLIEKEQAGRVYVNGRFLIDWGRDSRMDTNAPALFGMELQHSIPVWHGRIVDFDALKMEYASMWQELLIDAHHGKWNLASKLLSRLMRGRDPEDMEEDDSNKESGDDEKRKVSIHDDCLESQIMSSSKYDPVGICAKALATRFASEFGKSAFPCLEHEVPWVRSRLGHKTPVVVPQRLLNVLRRGGYFDVSRTTQDSWFSAEPVAKDEAATKIINSAVELLTASGCSDIQPSHVVLVDFPDQQGAVEHKFMCRFDPSLKQYHVNRQILEMDKAALTLGMYLAQEHPDGTVAVQYLLHQSGKN